MKCLRNRRAKKNAKLLPPRRTLGTLVVVGLIIFAGSEQLAQAQQQVPPDYELTILDADHTDWPDEWPALHEPDQEPVRILPYGINESGIVVGGAVNLFPHHERAFMYVHTTGRMIDLNLLDNARWLDLETNAETEGWFARRATGINLNNQIVGSALKDGQPDRFFVLNDPLGPVQTFELLPSIPGSSAYRSSGRINDFGVVAGYAGGIFVYEPPNYVPIDSGGTTFFVRDINKNGVVVAGSGGSDPGQIIAPDELGNYSVVYESANHHFSAINSFGIVTGYQVYNNQGRDKRDGGAIRFDFAEWESWQEDPNPTDPEPKPELLKSQQGNDRSRGDVNDNGVIFFGHDESTRTYERGFLYLEGQGSFPLDDYVVFNSLQDEADWFLKQIEPKGINNLGQLTCRSDGKGFLLTPIAPQPGITVTASANLTTTESGGQGTFTVRLETEPSADVTILISSDNTGEGTVSPTSLIFSPGVGWDTTQTVTITGVDDDPAFEDGDILYNIITAAAESADLDYLGIDADDLQVTNLDDDGQPSGGSQTWSRDHMPTGLTIPDNNSNGTSSIITIPATDNFEITNMSVILDISHPRPSDLEVWLSADVPNSPSVRLNNYSNDNPNLVPDDFDNILTADTQWTLELYDNRRKKTGKLIEWSITIDY